MSERALLSSEGAQEQEGVHAAWGVMPLKSFYGAKAPEAYLAGGKRNFECYGELKSWARRASWKSGGLNKDRRRSSRRRWSDTSDEGEPTQKPAKKLKSHTAPKARQKRRQAPVTYTQPREPDEDLEEQEAAKALVIGSEDDGDSSEKDDEAHKAPRSKSQKLKAAAISEGAEGR